MLHQPCYNGFIYSYELKSISKTEKNNKEIKTKILIQESCYLISDLVEEIANLCNIYCVKGKLNDNEKMKSFLLTNFQDNLQFTPDRRIPGKEGNLVNYVMASKFGAGLKDKGITLTFAKMKHQKLKPQELSKNFIHRKSHKRELDEYNSVKKSFNAASLSYNPTATINDHQSQIFISIKSYS